jgi:predicted GTPase
MFCSGTTRITVRLPLPPGKFPTLRAVRYPAALAGQWYPDGIPIIEEDLVDAVIRKEKVDYAVFSYSDISYPNLMHLGSRVLAAGADFWLPGRNTEVKSELPVISICAVRAIPTLS